MYLLMNSTEHVPAAALGKAVDANGVTVTALELCAAARSTRRTVLASSGLAASSASVSGRLEARRRGTAQSSAIRRSSFDAGSESAMRVAASRRTSPSPAVSSAG